MLRQILLLYPLAPPEVKRQCNLHMLRGHDQGKEDTPAGVLLQIALCTLAHVQKKEDTLAVLPLSTPEGR